MIKTSNFSCSYCNYTIPKINIFQESTLLPVYNKKDVTDVENYPKQFSILCSNCDRPNFTTDSMIKVLDYLKL